MNIINGEQEIILSEFSLTKEDSEKNTKENRERNIHRLPTSLGFLVNSENVFRQFEFSEYFEEIMEELTAKKEFLIMHDRKTKKLYKLLLKKHVIAFKMNTLYATDYRSRLFITGVYPLDFMTQNEFMRSGVLFHTEDEVFATVIDKYHGEKYAYMDGIKNYDWNDYNECDVLASLQEIEQVMNKEKNNGSDKEEQEIKEGEGEKKQRKNEYHRILDLAEQYVYLEDNMATADVMRKGKAFYQRILPVEQAERLDRIAYQFQIPLSSQEIHEGLFQDLHQKRTMIQIPLEDTDENEQAVDEGKETFIQGEILRSSEKENVLTIDVLFHQQVDLNKLPENGWISLAESHVVGQIQMRSIERLKDTENHGYLNQLIGENQSDGFLDDRESLERVDYFLQQARKMGYWFNESQERAIKGGILSKHMFLIEGPPGTGKTTVIQALAHYFSTQRNQRVLIASQSNKAVDNALYGVMKNRNGKTSDMLRVGSEEKIDPILSDVIYENKIQKIMDGMRMVVGKNMDAIKCEIHAWKIYYSKWHDALIGYERTEMDFGGIAGEDLNYHVKKLKNILEEFRENKNQLSVCAKIIKNEYDTITVSGMKRFFQHFKIQKTERELSAHVHEFERLMDKQEIILKKYRKAFYEYENSKQHFFEDKFRLFWVREKKYQKQLEEFKLAVPQAKSIHIIGFDLFSSARKRIEEIRIELGNEHGKDSFLLATREIEENLIKVTRTLSALSGWNETVLSSKNYGLQNLILQSARIVGATCIGLHTQRKFSDLDFDVVIMDEAGQIQVHNAIVPISMAKKVILLGDSMQIPPYADQTILEICEENGLSKELLYESFFEYLKRVYLGVDKRKIEQLDIQYRIPEIVAENISSWFYQGNYHSHESKREKNMHPILTNWISEKTFLWIDTSKEKDGTRIEENAGQWNSGYLNRMEANVIFWTIYAIHKEKQIRPNDLWNGTCLGVISAYKAQTMYIIEKLFAFYQKEYTEENISMEQLASNIATLDSFQGKERGIILYSFVRSSNKSSDKKRIGFLKELRRLNVAMTRAKNTLMMIGNLDFLSSCQNDEKDDMENIAEGTEKEFSSFIQMIRENMELKGKGEIIPYRRFIECMKEIKNKNR